MTLQRAHVLPLAEVPAHLAGHGVPARGAVMCYNIMVCDGLQSSAQTPGNVMPSPTCRVPTFTLRHSRRCPDPSALSGLNPRLSGKRPETFFLLPTTGHSL